MKERQINFRVDQQDVTLLEAIKKKLRMSTAGAIRHALLKLAELENIKIRSQGPQK